MTMKILTGLVFVLLGVNANARSSTVVFDCNAEIQIDVNETLKIGMTVEAQGVDYVAYYVGATQPGPLPTSKQVLSSRDGLQINGIREILSKVSLAPANRLKITSVVIYTEGNFDDDAAGVRAAEFVDAQGVILSKGMYFGWGGPVACQ